MNSLQTLFHFLIKIQSKCGWFSVVDTLRHAFLKAHGEPNKKALTWQEATTLADNKMHTLRTKFEDVPKVLFGKIYAHVMQ